VTSAKMRLKVSVFDFQNTRVYVCVCENNLR